MSKPEAKTWDSTIRSLLELSYCRERPESLNNAERQTDKTTTKYETEEQKLNTPRLQPGKTVDAMT